MKNALGSTWRILAFVLTFAVLAAPLPRLAPSQFVIEAATLPLVAFVAFLFGRKLPRSVARLGSARHVRGDRCVDGAVRPVAPGSRGGACCIGEPHPRGTALRLRACRDGPPVAPHRHSLRWNVIIGPVLGLTVSGSQALHAGASVVMLEGSELLTGGSFGIEASVTTAILVVLLARRQRSESGEPIAATAEQTA